MRAHKILLVDDEPDVLEIIKMSLKRCFFPLTINACHDGKKALEEFKKEAYSYSLIITDIRMPYLNGFQLANEARAIRPEIPVLFMTAFIVDENISGYSPTISKEQIISKPDDILKLCGIIEKELAIVAE